MPGTVSAVTQGTASFRLPHVSPDGRWISATRAAGQGDEIVKMPWAGGDPVVLVNGVNGSWSPDGRRFALAATRGGKITAWVGGSDGQDATELARSWVRQCSGWTTAGSRGSLPP